MGEQRRYTITCSDSDTTIHDDNGATIGVEALYDLYWRIHAMQPREVYIGWRWVDRTHGWIYKIGVSDNVYRRASELKLQILHTIPCPYDDLRDAERVLHGYYIERGCWLYGEWFNLYHESEAFYLQMKSVEDIFDRCDTYLDWRWFPPKRNEIKAAYEAYRQGKITKPVEYWKELDEQAYEAAEEE